MGWFWFPGATASQQNPKKFGHVQRSFREAVCRWAISTSSIQCPTILLLYCATRFYILQATLTGCSPRARPSWTLKIDVWSMWGWSIHVHPARYWRTWAETTKVVLEDTIWIKSYNTSMHGFASLCCVELRPYHMNFRERVEETIDAN